MSTSLKDALQNLVSEYIREAEHQDGESYWNNFSSLQELLDDVKRYAAYNPNE